MPNHAVLCVLKVGGRSREESGLRGGGPSLVITDMAVLGFDPYTRLVSLVSLHPGIRLEELMEKTGFPLHILKQIYATPLPTSEELSVLREEIDPKCVYL